MGVVWLTVFAAQLVVCLYLGYRVAVKTDRSLVNWLAVGFLAAVPPFIGVVLMIGGNIPGVTRTISIDIYDQVEAANYASANQTALVLLIISFLLLSVVYGLNRRGVAMSRWK